MSDLSITIVIASITAISAVIIDNCLEWKKYFDVKILLIKVIGYTAILAILIYPFSISLMKKGFSYKSLAIAYFFGFGYVLPISRQIIGLIYMRFNQSDAESR
jgi:hypothetical protein